MSDQLGSLEQSAESLNAKPGVVAWNKNQQTNQPTSDQGLYLKHVYLR